MTNMVAVHLYGPLADRFGAHHEFAISTPTEAIHALDANYPGFLAAFVQHESYAIVADDDLREGATVAFPVSRDVHFCPIIEGRAFAGAALIGALIPGLAGTVTASILGGLLMAGLMIGISMLLSPKPEETEDTKKDESYAFTGPENVTGQGAAVPLVYGRVHCGSVVISAGLELNTEVAPASSFAAPPPGAGSVAVAPGLPPYPGGFPPIVPAPPLVQVVDQHGVLMKAVDEVEEVTHPAGWIMTNIMDVNVSGTAKRVLIFQPEVQPYPEELVYAWNERQGYYALVKVQVEDEEWVATQ